MPLPPLYKYLDVQGAQLTLGNRTFKHAKPSDFNDTEDLTIQSIFPEETEMALEKLRCGFTDVILQHLNDPPKCSSPMKEKVALIQQVYRTNPEAADVVKAELTKEGAKPAFDVDHMRMRAEAFLKEINEHMQATRVLCVTTHKDSEKMWSGYAENHKGIALRIEPNLAKDSKFQLFRPVIYREKRPPLYEDTLEFIAGSLFEDLETCVKAMLEKIIYTKTLEWAHENEYRLAIPMRQNEEPWNTLPYHPEEIVELCLGLAMEKADIDHIVGMALAVNPNIAIFRAKRWPDGSLGFDRV
jgi:Protein of unknown function (DUF2971)